MATGATRAAAMSFRERGRQRNRSAMCPKWGRKETRDAINAANRAPAARALTAKASQYPASLDFNRVVEHQDDLARHQ